MSTPNALPELPSLPDEIQHAIDNYFIFTPERVKELMQDYAIAAIAATTKPADSAAVQVEPVAWQEYDSVTRESAENAIEYMSSYNGRGREVDAQAMLVTTPPPPSIGGEVTDAEIGRIANSYGVDSIQGFDHIKAFARAIIAATSTKPADSAAVRAEAAPSPIQAVATVIEDLGHDGEGFCAKVRWLFNPVPDGEELLWNHGPGYREYERPAITPPAPTAQPVAPGWKPIETAPKDGTELLLRSKNGRHADGAWIAVNGSKGYWAWALVKAEPTHWMPLPVAPSMPPKEGV